MDVPARIMVDGELVQNPEYVLYSIFLSALAGVLHIVLGVFRLGFVSRLLSVPVLSGFISASAVLVILAQIKPLLGN